MGTIGNLWKEMRSIRRITREVLSEGTITYTLNVFGMHVKGKSIWIYALFPVFLVVAYAGCAVSLYAFDTLLGVPEFSWINTFWWMIIIATVMCAFNNGGD